MTDHYKSRASTHADGCWDLGHGHYECAVWKIKALQAEVKQLRADLMESDEIREKLGHLLTRTATALKGEPPEGTWHSWHDLPEKATRLVEALKKVAQSLEWYAHGRCRGFDDEAHCRQTKRLNWRNARLRRCAPDRDLWGADMTTDEIIKLAREADRWATNQTSDTTYEWKVLRDERFAALVAAFEREECAKVCEYRAMALDYGGNLYVRDYAALDCARSIRAREASND